MTEILLYILIIAAVCALTWTVYLVVCNAAFNTHYPLARSPYTWLPWVGAALSLMIYWLVS
jgi:hypothetical protein